MAPSEPNTSASAIENAGKAPNIPGGSDLAEAVMLYRNGRFDEAAQTYQHLLETQPKSAEAYAGLARVYIKHKKSRRRTIRFQGD